MNLIKSARVSTGKLNETKLVNILFDEEIIEISSSPITCKVNEIFDLEGLLLIPGCIDAHVHFNDPGYTHHENFISGTSSAAAGGITTIIDMPCTSIPAVTNVENLQSKLNVIQPKALIDFALWAGVPGNDFPFDDKSIRELWQAGVIGFKIYTISGMETFKALTYKQIELVLDKFPEMMFAFHAEDPHTIESAMQNFSYEDLAKPSTYTYTRPPEAEVSAVKEIMAVCSKHNHIHIVHVGSAKAAAEIINNNSICDVSWETCPHYLQFTIDDFSKLKGKIKTAPPVKFKADKEFLRSCLQDGSLNFVTTDHAGCDWESEKNLENFSRVYNGIPGTELFIPYLFSEFHLKGKIPLSRMIELTSENAAKRYGLYPGKGSLKIGSDADFTVIDLNKSFIVNEKELHCLGKYSPFHGETFECSINKTFVRGKMIFAAKQGIVGKPGWGKWIKRNN